MKSKKVKGKTEASPFTFVSINLGRGYLFAVPFAGVFAAGRGVAAGGLFAFAGGRAAFAAVFAGAPGVPALLVVLTAFDVFAVFAPVFVFVFAAVGETAGRAPLSSFGLLTTFLAR
jgi:hypothetical protein